MPTYKLSTSKEQNYVSLIQGLGEGILAYGIPYRFLFALIYFKIVP